MVRGGHSGILAVHAPVSSCYLIESYNYIIHMALTDNYNSVFIYRFCPGVVANNMDNSLITWLLVVVCTPHCIRNPYLIAKIIEVLFVINPSVQVSL